ncbi:glycosyltransferase [Roseiflexus sp.]|uniref:glycosyltransferase n=1 Tax=Roseiflexus sp. TaxID=2562120 RepID=UPI0021DC21BF|nr:glycosyltransferase [Roseiflexus sp.]GIW02207.1 MAG: glycosyl transferase [Roseiflexus sp.]
MPIGVAMILHDFYPSIGGAQTHTLALSRALRARGIDAIAVTRPYPGTLAYEEVQGIPTYRVGMHGGRVLAGVSYLAAGLALLIRERNRYQILHCHQMISPMTLALMARALPEKRLVINPHGRGPRGDVAKLTRLRPITGKLRVAAALRWGDAFVAISRDIHDELCAMGVQKERIWDIANGVDVERFAPASPNERTELRRRLGLPDGRLVVFVGRLTVAKALDVLLNAWAQRDTTLADARLIIVGDGELRNDLMRQARDLGVEQSVMFAGATNDTAAYLRACDAFVLSSRTEGMPVALLEAMACGLPCVATRVGGSIEIIEDGVNGRLVMPEDVGALARAVAQALATPEWGVHARRHIQERYAIDTVAQRYVALYESLVNGRSAGAVRTPA